MRGDREQSGVRLWLVNIAPHQAPPTLIPPENDAPRNVTIPPNINTETSVPPPPQSSIVQPEEAPHNRPIGVTLPNGGPRTQMRTNITPKAVRTLDLPSTSALIAYYHTTAGYPVKQT